MKKSLLLIVFMLLLSSLVFAQTENNKAVDFNQYINDLPQLKDTLNSYMGKLPGFAKPFVSNDKINLHFIRESGEVVDIHAELKGGKVNVLDKGNLDKADIELTIKESDVNEIINSNNPRKAVKDKLNSGSISYKVNGFFKGLKFKLLKSFL